MGYRCAALRSGHRPSPCETNPLLLHGGFNLLDMPPFPCLLPRNHICQGLTTANDSFSANYNRNLGIYFGIYMNICFSRTMRRYDVPLSQNIWDVGYRFEAITKLGSIMGLQNHLCFSHCRFALNCMVVVVAR